MDMSNEYNSDEEIDDIMETPNEDINLLMKNYKSKMKKYKTNNYLTKYEKTKILSERSSQIDDGSVIYLDDYSMFDNSYEIACEELKQRKLPFIIKRPYGNTFEYWKLADLQ
jgi:DNA-directed RNA polymerase subunit K/omega